MEFNVFIFLKNVLLEPIGIKVPVFLRIEVVLSAIMDPIRIINLFHKNVHQQPNGYHHNKYVSLKEMVVLKEPTCQDQVVNHMFPVQMDRNGIQRDFSAAVPTAHNGMENNAFHVMVEEHGYQL